jgi:AcrR family transcriptional regulator
MSLARAERADAARNRAAILRATERLLATHRPDQVSMEQVAAAAGVGKGTVFHRFGSRVGLMIALMQERAHALDEQVRTGPPPIGPGAPPRERLLAFLDAVVDVVGRNKGLLAALGHAAQATANATHGRSPACREADPVYQRWHAHVSALITAQRPDLDAELLSHVLLGALRGEAILGLLERGEGDRLAAALRTLVLALLGPLP